MKRWICYLASLLFFPLPAVSEGADPPTPDELAEKVRAAMRRYLVEVGTRLCGSIRERSGPNEGPLWQQRKVQIVQNGRYGYVVEETDYLDGSHPTSWALLCGPAVRAALEKAQDGKWVVVDYAVKRSLAIECWQLTYQTAVGYMLLAFPSPAASKQLWSEGVRLLPTSWEEVDGRRLLRVPYQILPEEQRGEVWLDPGRMWAIVRGRWQRAVRRGNHWGTQRTELQVDYDDTYAPYPVPKRRRGDWVVVGASNNGSAGWWETVYELRIPEELPKDGTFTLARFGVPNVAGVPVKREAAPWLWIGLVACVMAGLLWWLRSRMRGAGEGNPLSQRRPDE